MTFFHKIPVYIFSLFYPCKIIGKENIPKGGAVLVCNHFRAIDCGFIALAYSKDIKFLAKNELFKNKLVGKVLKSYGGIPIDRDNPDMKSMLSCIRYVKDGHKLCVFPEGTRNKTGTTELQSIKGGSAVFAVKAKSPIIPMMLSRKAKIFRKTHLIIGKPIDLEEYYGKKLNNEDIEKLDEILRDKMLEEQARLEKLTKKKER